MSRRGLKFRLAGHFGGMGLAAGAVVAGIVHFETIEAWAARALVRAETALSLTVDRVEIAGRELTPQPLVEQAIGPVEGRPMTSLDLVAMRERIEAISWIVRADVARRLPDRLAVRLTEREPFALWQQGNELALIDPSGVVLTRDALARWRDLPMLAGAGAPEAAPDLLELLETEPALGERVAAMIRVGGRRWDLRMDSGITVRLPDRASEPGYGPAEAWRRLVALERRHRLLARAITIVDLRLADRLVLRLSPQGQMLGLAGDTETSL